MFIDDVTVLVKGGKGGNGSVAFRREKYVPRGGPAGGDGGKGGSVIFVGDEGLTTLLDFRYQKRIVAQNGENGKSKNCYGKDGADLYIKVPLGTTVTDLKQGAVVADITRHGQEAVIARGGRGGRGNTRFATPKIPAPEFAENGE
ncbi:MAG TPA: GTPase ObgE, partial [Acholeplasmataceae bacterium]|nr:GTPase ObgE [Acholeplasmataceae bacterium]